MPGRILAAARTPWAPRHTNLDGVRPEAMLEAAIAGAVARAELDVREIDRILVACDTSVGAQDLNLARRVALSLGWTTVPGLTVDGQGVSGLALVDLSVSLPGTTVVAGVDASSSVPPGAGLVRDYGRPTMVEPEHVWLERLAREHALERADLDEAVAVAMAAADLMSPAILPDAVAGVAGDTSRVIERDDAAPLTEDGLLTTDHLAPWADGAVAVVIGDRPDGRAVEATSVSAGTDRQAVEWMAAAPNVVAADHSAVVVALGGRAAAPIVSPLTVGSAPSCDGLRVLADVFATVDGRVEVRTRGRNGQMATVTLAALTDDSDPVSRLTTA